MPTPIIPMLNLAIPSSIFFLSLVSVLPGAYLGF